MKIVLNTHWNANIKGLFIIVDENGLLIKDGFESLESAIEWKQSNQPER